jgi:hypothetical protein
MRFRPVNGSVAPLVGCPACEAGLPDVVAERPVAAGAPADGGDAVLARLVEDGVVDFGALLCADASTTILPCMNGWIEQM